MSIADAHALLLVTNSLLLLVTTIKLIVTRRQRDAALRDLARMEDSRNTALHIAREAQRVRATVVGNVGAFQWTDTGWGK